MVLAPDRAAALLELALAASERADEDAQRLLTPVDAQAPDEVGVERLGVVEPAALEPLAEAGQRGARQPGALVPRGQRAGVCCGMRPRDHLRPIELVRRLGLDSRGGLLGRRPRKVGIVAVGLDRPRRGRGRGRTAKVHLRLTQPVQCPVEPGRLAGPAEAEPTQEAHEGVPVAPGARACRALEVGCRQLEPELDAPGRVVARAQLRP